MSIFDDMKLGDTLVGVLIGVVLTGIVGVWYVDAQEDKFRQEIQAANEEAQDWKLAWNEYAKAYEERALQILESDSLMQEVHLRNEELANALEERGNDILALQETNTHLKARLDSSASEVTQTEATEYTIKINERVAFRNGGFVKVIGDVVLETVTPSLSTDLGVEGEVPLTIVLSRNDANEIVVNAFTGDPRLTVSRLDVQRLAERPANVNAGGALEAIGEHLTSGNVWLGRLEGAGMCLIGQALLGR